ncbi:MAG TPA: TolC family protein [Bacteroidales bacterium]|jgi:outer membrane protein TolC|nr:MAG: Outer membrane efflux protein [Bacteroidetes bacterium ADurb.Bin012]HPV34008.1 TolC family protein [Bacteroidales bacterium]HQF17959.1 TolC family protein [Bacteroidales bacterium]HRS33588.1 TolC family protein [Bacteroidales bacterium]
MNNIIMRKIIYLIFTILMGSLDILHVHSQGNVVRLSLEEVIQTASEQSPDALMARHRFLSSYWEYRSYLAQFKPKLSLSATIPSLTKSMNSYTLPDGTETFVHQQYTSYTGTLSLSQVIGFSGGSIYIQSGLQRLRNNLDSAGLSSWLSHPVTIGLRQPIYNFNSYKWQRRIDPIRYLEATRRYIEDMEQISITVTRLFFNLIIAEGQLQISRINEANYDTLYRIARGRFNMGTIAENELLQLELNLLKSRADAENARLDVENSEFILKSYLRLKGQEKIQLIPPSIPNQGSVSVSDAIEYARENRATALEFERRILEARRDLDQAKHEGRFQANLSIDYGLSKNGPNLSEVYKNLDDMQQLSFGVYVPILDWGQAKGRIKMAESNNELVKTAVEQESIDFEQEVYLAVMQYNMQKNQMEIAAKSDTVADKSYQVAKARYLIGKISITDLNIAQSEKDLARMNFLRALQRYWNSYYTIRKLTHFDFTNNLPIRVDLNKIIE